MYVCPVTHTEHSTELQYSQILLDVLMMKAGWSTAETSGEDISCLHEWRHALTLKTLCKSSQNNDGVCAAWPETALPLFPYIMDVSLCPCIITCGVVCEFSQTPPDLCLHRLISAVHRGALCALHKKLWKQWIHCLTAPSPVLANPCTPFCSKGEQWRCPLRCLSHPASRAFTWKEGGQRKGSRLAQGVFSKNLVLARFERMHTTPHYERPPLSSGDLAMNVLNDKLDVIVLLQQLSKRNHLKQLSRHSCADRSIFSIKHHQFWWCLMEKWFLLWISEFSRWNSEKWHVSVPYRQITDTSNLNLKI